MAATEVVELWRAMCVLGPLSLHAGGAGFVLRYLCEQGRCGRGTRTAGTGAKRRVWGVFQVWETARGKKHGRAEKGGNTEKCVLEFYKSAKK